LCAGELVAVLDVAIQWLDALEGQGEGSAGRWQVRVQAAATIAAALRTSRRHLSEELLTRGLQRVFALLSDEVYAARRQGGCMVPRLLQDSPQQRVRP